MTCFYRSFLMLITLMTLCGCSVISDVWGKPTATLQSGSVLFADDFSTMDNGWMTWNQDDSSVSYQAGGLYFFNNLSNFDFWSRPGFNYSDVIIQTDAIKIGGPDNNSFGVICRMMDESNLYAFVISSDGYAAILKVSEGSYELLNGDSMEFFSAIAQGDSLNRITAECNGNRLSLAINGQGALQAEDSSFSAGDIGYIVGTFDEAGVEILFDNLVVYQP